MSFSLFARNLAKHSGPSIYGCAWPTTAPAYLDDDEAATVAATSAYPRPGAILAGSDAERGMPMQDTFRAAAERTAHAVGTYWAFLAALATVAVWGVTGPYFAYSDTWQLFINTGTTIVTFLMVFLIQNTQNRESRVMALKLDELIRAVEGARTGFVDLDHMSDEELEEVQKEFSRLKEKYAPLVDDDLAHVQHALAKRHRRRPKK
jgi:low affinity Fe/Cu permease